MSSADGKTAEDDFDIENMLGFKYRTSTEIAFWTVALLTAGLSLLVFYWWPEFVVPLRHEACALGDADFVLVLSRTGSEARLCTVEQMTAVSACTWQRRLFGLLPPVLPLGSMLPAEQRMFVHHNVRFAYVARTQTFAAVASVGSASIAALRLVLKHGLSNDRAAALLDMHGHNSTMQPPPSWLSLLLRHMLHPFAFLYALQACALAIWVDQGDGQATVAVGNALASIFFLTLGVRTLRDTHAARAALVHGDTEQDAAARTVLARRDGVWSYVPTAHIVPGDVIALTAASDRGRVRGGDSALPCDAVLLCGTALVDDAALTGRDSVGAWTGCGGGSVRVHGILDDAASSDAQIDLLRAPARHTLSAGTRLLAVSGGVRVDECPASPCALALVVRTGFHTHQGALLVGTLRRGLAPSSPFVVSTRRLIIVTSLIAVLMIAIAALRLGTMKNLHMTTKLWVFQILNMAIDLRPPILPMALAASSVAWLYRMRHRFNVLSVGPRLTHLVARLDVVCVDKTGTLTQARTRLHGFQACYTGVAAAGDGSVSAPLQFAALATRANELPSLALHALATCHALQSQGTSDAQGVCGDAVERALFELSGARMQTPSSPAPASDDSASLHRIVGADFEFSVLASRPFSSIPAPQLDVSSSAQFTAAVYAPLSAVLVARMHASDAVGSENSLPVVSADAAATTSQSPALVATPPAAATDSAPSEAMSARMLGSNEIVDHTMVAIEGVGAGAVDSGAAATLFARLARGDAPSSARVTAASASVTRMVVIKGAVTDVLRLCGAHVNRAAVHTRAAQYARTGASVLAVAVKPLLSDRAQGSDSAAELDAHLRGGASDDAFELLGLAVFAEELRQDACTVVRTLQHDARIRPVLVTGDELPSALAVARASGIVATDARVFEAQFSSASGGVLEWVCAADGSVLGGAASAPMHADAARAVVRRDRGGDEDSAADDDDYPMTAFPLGSPHVSHINVGANVAMTGETFDWLCAQPEQATLHRALAASSVFARMRPAQKARLVAELQKLGAIVGAVGDAANDAPMLACAHVAAALVENSTSDSIVANATGDGGKIASPNANAAAVVAAPFTITSLSALLALVAQGKSALATSLELARLITTYSLTYAFAYIILYFDEATLGSWQFAYRVLVIVLPTCALLGTAPPSMKISPARPSVNPLSPRNVASIGGHSMLFFITQVAIEGIVSAHPSVPPYLSTLGLPFTLTPSNWHSTAMYWLTNLQLCIIVALVARGRPFTASHYTPLFVWQLVCIALSIAHVLIPKTSGYFFFTADEVDLPYALRLAILGLALANAVAAYAWQRAAVPWLARAWTRCRAAGKAPSDGAADDDGEEPLSQFHELREAFERNIQ